MLLASFFRTMLMFVLLETPSWFLELLLLAKEIINGLGEMFKFHQLTF